MKNHPSKVTTWGPLKKRLHCFFCKGNRTQRPWFGLTRFSAARINTRPFQVPRPRKAKTCPLWFEVPPPFPSGLLFTRWRSYSHDSWTWSETVSVCTSCVSSLHRAGCVGWVQRALDGGGIELHDRTFRPTWWLRATTVFTRRPEPKCWWMSLLLSRDSFHLLSICISLGAALSRQLKNLQWFVQPSRSKSLWWYDHADDDSCPSWSNQRSDLPDLDLPAVDGNTKRQALTKSASQTDI